MIPDVQGVGVRECRFRQNTKQSDPVSVVIVAFAIGRLPPLFRYIDLGTKIRGIPWLACQTGEPKEVPGHFTSWVRLGQKRHEPRSCTFEIIKLRVAQLPYQDWLGAAQAVKRLRWKPIRLFYTELTPRRCDHGEAGNISCFPHKVRNRCPLILIEEVQVIDEQNRSTVCRKIR
ncbi:MAG: hypothetical protein OEW25_00060 [Nitrospira sp.]|nr:hypothetical protein [Nitrospira sp.]MDH5251691.1 hypothetical protein [Nitrospira sp.]